MGPCHVVLYCCKTVIISESSDKSSSSPVTVVLCEKYLNSKIMRTITDAWTPYWRSSIKRSGRTSCSRTLIYAGSFSSSPEILLGKPKLNYRVRKSTSLVPVLSHISPVRAAHSISWRSVLILPFHISLGLPNGLFLSGYVSFVAEE